MPYSQSPKSPLAKALKGNQHKLPDHLKAKIEAAPESPVKKKGDAPSRKKSLGYYNKANKTGTGAAAGGGMTAKGTAEYRRKNPGSKLKTAVTGKVKNQIGKPTGTLFILLYLTYVVFLIYRG